MRIGIIENLELTVAGVSLFVQAFIINNAPYKLLLGRPFQAVGQIDTADVGETLVMKDPQTKKTIRIPTRPYRGSPEIAPVNLLLASQLMSQSALKYKPKRRFPEDPLLSLVPLTPHPPPIGGFTKRLTEERWNALKIGRDFLTAEEVKLAFFILKNNEDAIAWEDEERGTFREDYFDPIIIPTVEHTPWAERNYPIPPGLRQQVIETIQKKIASGVYEPSS